MTGPKTNERPGVRARASHVRSSAYKAREVLDLIRGKSCVEARDELAFCERGVARTIAKVLSSAVANAENNNGLDGEDLYVAACYADEGPTLKRWRPRARGRATRIRKRTCHITVIVSAYDEAALDARRASTSARRSEAAIEARRRRVARSRAERAGAAAVEAEARSEDEPDQPAQRQSDFQAEPPDTAEEAGAPPADSGSETDAGDAGVPGADSDADAAGTPESGASSETTAESGDGEADVSAETAHDDPGGAPPAKEGR